MKNLKQIKLMMERLESPRMTQTEVDKKKKEILKEEKESINEIGLLAVAGGVILGGAILKNVYKWGKNKILRKNILPTGEKKEIRSKVDDKKKAVLSQYKDKRNGDLYWGVEYMDFTTADPGYREHSIMLWKDNPEQIEKMVRHFEEGGDFKRPTGMEGDKSHHGDYFGPFKSDVKIDLPSF